MLKRWRRTVTFTDLVVWGIGVVIAAAIIIGTIRTLQAAQYTAEQWIYLVIGGLKLGGIYALIALGYTLVYGILRMINFAHSEVFMSGPFTAVFLAIYLNNTGFYNSHPLISLGLITIVSVTVSSTVALLLERVAYRKLRYAPRLVPLITAIGASFFLQYTFKGFYGANIKPYPNLDALAGPWTIGPVTIPKTDAVVILSAFFMMLLLYSIVQFTKTGKAMRAVSEDKEVAALMGVDVDRIIVFTFGLGGASAGLAGVLYALVYQNVHYFMGFIPGLKAFTAAVLGGIGNVVGAWLGGMILGLLESLGPNLFLSGLGIPAPNQLKDGIAFAILVLILIFRPTGLLGERISKTKA
ncbi:MAG: branched-chain amino acid ABC transporter permease [Anaerolineae bacterium]|nr:branched-chain amino acid ABC transporter permease [Anaerolineae bacterium]